MDAQKLIAQMSAKTDDPSKQLLSLFDVLSHYITQNAPTYSIQDIFNEQLNQYCIKLSQRAQASHPKVLANHLVFIAKNAFLQEISSPGNRNLAHAKKVAQALIVAQTQTPKNTQNDATWHFFLPIGIASLSVTAMIAIFFWPTTQSDTPQYVAQKSALHPSSWHERRTSASGLTAHEASAMYAQFELMRSGTCRYIEALQIPDQDKAVYLESVVGGKLPTNLKDLATANAYLAKIDCNYTPMLMKKSN